MTERDERLDELLGAYELDALEPDERAEVEVYLRRTPAAGREAERLRRTVDALAMAADEAAVPSHLWPRIQLALHEERPPGPELPSLRLPPPEPAVVVPLAPRRAARRGRVGALVAGLAAALLLAVGIGVVVGRQGDRAPSVEQLADAALRRPDARVGALAGDGGPSVQAVIDPDGRGYLLAGDLPALPEDDVYQLWTLDGTEPVSLAVLGNDPGVVAFPAGAGVTTLAITRERAPGVPAPSAAPLVSGQVA